MEIIKSLIKMNSSLNLKKKHKKEKRIELKMICLQHLLMFLAQKH